MRIGHHQLGVPGARLAGGELVEVESARADGAVEFHPVSRLVLVVELRRGPEEALLADLALVGALGQADMGLARGGALDLAQRDPVLGHGFLLCLCLQHAAADLVELDRFEQGAEIALAEALVAAALDDLEEDGADHRLGEDLQQEPAALGRRAVDQDAVGGQTLQVLAVTRQALVDLLEIGVRHGLERHALGPERLDRLVDVVGAERDVLDALAVIGREVFLDLRLVVGALVDRDADLAARAGHRLALQPGELAFDVEVADFAEIEEAFVEIGPLRHAPAMDVVRQVIDVGEADALGIVLDAGQILEVDVVDRAALAVTVDQVDQRIADALDRRDIELHRPDLALDAPGAKRQRPLVGEGRVLDPERDGANAGAVHARETLGEAVLLGIDDEVDVALAVERDILGAVLRDLHEAHVLEQRAERRWIGCCVFDELEAVGAHRIDFVDLGDFGTLDAGHMRPPELTQAVN